MPATNFCPREYFDKEINLEDLNIRGSESETSESELFILESDVSTDGEWEAALDGTQYEFRAETNGQVTGMDPKTEPGIPSKFVQPGERPEQLRPIENSGKSYLASIQVVNAPDDFYVTLLRDRSEKERLEEAIDDTYSSPDYGIPKVTLLVPGLLVAIFSAEKCWHRAEILAASHDKDKAIVLETEGEIFNVLLIDEGIKCEIPLSRIRYLSRAFLDYRMVTQKCEIDNIPGGFPWTDVAIQRFREIVIPGIRIELKFINVHENDPNTWIVRFKLHMGGYCSYDMRYVDVEKEINIAKRRNSILAMYRPLPSVEDIYSDFF